MSEKKHPQQNVHVDDRGVVRFVANPLVVALLDAGGLSLNQLAVLSHEKGWTDEDSAQFAQLIGYSVSGYCDLSYVSDEACALADSAADAMMKERETADE